MVSGAIYRCRHHFPYILQPSDENIKYEICASDHVRVVWIKKEKQTNRPGFLYFSLKTLPGRRVIARGGANRGTWIPLFRLCTSCILRPCLHQPVSRLISWNTDSAEVFWLLRIYPCHFSHQVNLRPFGTYDIRLPQPCRDSTCNYRLQSEESDAKKQSGQLICWQLIMTRG